MLAHVLAWIQCEHICIGLSTESMLGSRKVYPGSCNGFLDLNVTNSRITCAAVNIMACLVYGWCPDRHERKHVQYLRQILGTKLSNLQLMYLKDLEDSHFEENSFPRGVQEKVNNLLLLIWFCWRIIYFLILRMRVFILIDLSKEHNMQITISTTQWSGYGDNYF